MTSHRNNSKAVIALLNSKHVINESIHGNKNLWELWKQAFMEILKACVHRN